VISMNGVGGYKDKVTCYLYDFVQRFIRLFEK